MRFFILLVLLFQFTLSFAQKKKYDKPEGTATELRGALNPDRSCFNVHFYHLKVRINPVRQWLSGQNIIYFQMDSAVQKIQIDLYRNMKITEILWNDQVLPFTRKHNAVLIHFPELLEKGSNQAVTVKYQGSPQVGLGTAGDLGFHWKKDKRNRYWVGLMAEHVGASLWYPNKDHLSDEPDSVRLEWEAPKGLSCISNGTLQKVDTLDDYLRHHWLVKNPIDNYNIAFYLGHYKTKELAYISPIDSSEHILSFKTLDYEPEEDIERTFRRADEALALFEQLFGAYPFWEDGFSIVQSPHRGMEHQGCLAIDDLSRNTMRGNQKYNRTVIHEIAHEWWGNSISVSDMADVWLQEGFATYSEYIFSETLSGHNDYMRKMGYLESRYERKYSPIIGKRDINENMFRNNDIYDKGALVLHKLRMDIDDDKVFFQVLKTFHIQYSKKTVTTDDFINTVNLVTKKDYREFIINLLKH